MEKERQIVSYDAWWGVGEYERRAKIMCGDVRRFCAEIMCGDLRRWAGILVKED